MAVVRWISRKQLDKIEKELDYLRKHTVWVGFVGGEADKKVDGVAIYMYANFNEYGGGNTPSRPFFRTALNNNKKVYRDICNVGHKLQWILSFKPEKLGNDGKRIQKVCCF